MNDSKINVKFFSRDGAKIGGRFWYVLPRVGDEVKMCGKFYRVRRIVFGVELNIGDRQAVNIELEDAE